MPAGLQMDPVWLMNLLHTRSGHASNLSSALPRLSVPAPPEEKPEDDNT